MEEELTLQSYWRDIFDLTPLSRERESELAAKIREGDKSALDELVVSNLKFVVSVAKEYQNRGLFLTELIAEGNIGLMTAAERFDETRGYKFISYAVWWVRQSITQALAEKRNVHRPLNKLGDALKIHKARDHLYGVLEREPRDYEIANYLDISVQAIGKIMISVNSEVSLETPVDEEGDRNLGHTLVAEDGDSSLDLEFEHMRDTVKKYIGILDGREQYILTRYFGLDGENPATLETIGKEMSRTRERIRQLKERAFTKIRESNGNVSVEDEVLY